MMFSRAFALSLVLALPAAAQSTHSGAAASAWVDLTGTTAPTLTFGCNYQTDTTGTATDQRFVRIFEFATNSFALNEQLSTIPGNATVGACAAMGVWHNHTVTLVPAWGQIKVKFYFNTVDGNANAFAGWSVDDVWVKDGVTTLLLSNLDTPADAATWTFANTDPSVGWAADGTPASMPGGAAKSPPASLNYNDGTDYDGAPAPPPTIQLNPTSLTFSAPHGGVNPALQTLTVTNSGAAGSTLAFTATWGEAWLSLSPAGGSLASGASSTPAVSVNTAGLAPGTYTATITVAATNATNTPQTASITLTVTPAPKIGAAPASLQFRAVQNGGALPSQALAIANTGSTGTTLSFSAADDAAWLSGSGSGSVAAGGSHSLRIQVNHRGLAPGTYGGAITVSDPAAVNNPVAVPVQLIVDPTPAMIIDEAAPSPWFAGTQGPVTVRGSGFAAAGGVTAVTLSHYATGTLALAGITVVDDATVTGTLTVPSTVVENFYGLTVTRADGVSATGGFVQVVRLTGPPELAPAALCRGATQPLQISLPGVYVWAATTLTLTRAGADAISISLPPSFAWFQGAVSVPAGAPTGSYDLSVSLNGSPPVTFADAVVIDTFAGTGSPSFQPARFPVEKGAAYLLLPGHFQASALPTVSAVRSGGGPTLTPTSVSIAPDGAGLEVAWTWDPTDLSVVGTYDAQITGAAHTETLAGAFEVTAFLIRRVEPERWLLVPPGGWGENYVRVLGEGFEPWMHARLDLDPGFQAAYAQSGSGLSTGAPAPVTIFASSREFLLSLPWGLFPGLYRLTLEKFSGEKTQIPVWIGAPEQGVRVTINPHQTRTGELVGSPFASPVFVRVANEGTVPMGVLPFRIETAYLDVDPGYPVPTSVGPLDPGEVQWISIMIRARPLSELPADRRIGPTVGLAEFHVRLGETLDEKLARFGDEMAALRAFLAEDAARGATADRQTPWNEVCRGINAMLSVLKTMAEIGQAGACDGPGATAGQVGKAASAAKDVADAMELIEDTPSVTAAGTVLDFTEAVTAALDANTAAGQGNVEEFEQKAKESLVSFAKEVAGKIPAVGECIKLGMELAEMGIAVVQFATETAVEAYESWIEANRNQNSNLNLRKQLLNELNGLPGGTVRPDYQSCPPDRGGPPSASATVPIGTSLDPNEKLVDVAQPFGIRRRQRLQYLIRFENTAHDPITLEPLPPEALPFPALTVDIEDTLDPSLDPTSVEFGATSHDGALASATVTEVSPGVFRLRWVFDEINLPANVMPPEGEGFVTFSARPRAGTASGTRIRNSATIYFDRFIEERPITTNTVETVLDEGPPALTEVTVLERKATGVRVRVDAQDSETGVLFVRILRRSSPTVPWEFVGDVPVASPAEVVLPAGGDFATAQFLGIATDLAGNESSPREGTDAPAGTGAGGVGGGGGRFCVADGGMDASFLALALLGAAYAAVRLARAARP